MDKALRLKCASESELLLVLGVESEVVETTEVGEKITEDESQVATEGMTSEAPAAPLESTGKLGTRCRHILKNEHKAALHHLYDSVP